MGGVGYHDSFHGGIFNTPRVSIALRVDFYGTLLSIADAIYSFRSFFVVVGGCGVEGVSEISG